MPCDQLDMKNSLALVALCVSGYTTEDLLLIQGLTSLMHGTGMHIHVLYTYVHFSCSQTGLHVHISSAHLRLKKAMV